MDAEQIKGISDSILSLMNGQKTTEEDAEKVNENIATITGIINKIDLVVADGLQLADVTKIGGIIPDVMKLAAGFKDYSGEDKKRFVQEVVWLVYRAIDTLPDGKRNNINVPWVAGIFERQIERTLITFAAGLAVDAIYKRMRAANEV